MINLLNLVKNTILLLIFIYIAPLLIYVIKNQYHVLLEQKTKVGVIIINEPLYEAQPYIDTLATLGKDTEIKAILLRIQCHGGTPGAVQALHNEIRAFKKEYVKPVGAYIENSTTSGYYIATSADFIIATPVALIGNIGIYTLPPDQFFEQTEQGKHNRQALIDEIYRQCIDDITKTRQQIVSEKIQEWTNGKTVTGKKALDLGLIDAIGSSSTVEAFLRKITPIDGHIEWVYINPNNKTCTWTLSQYWLHFLHAPYIKTFF